MSNEFCKKTDNLTVKRERETNKRKTSSIVVPPIPSPPKRRLRKQ